MVSTQSDESRCYRVYGLKIQIDGLLPGLLPEYTEPADIYHQVLIERRLTSMSSPAEIWQLKRYDNETRFYSGPDYDIWTVDCSEGRYYRIDLSDNGRAAGSCLINPAGDQVRWHFLRGNYPGPEAFFTLIAKRSMGWLLRLHAITCLHATVVVVDGRAIALVGESGAGKSTLAASFLAQGYSLLTDDVAALQDEGCVFYVQPGFPRLPLLPTTISHFFQSIDNFRYVWPSVPPASDEKRYVDLAVNGMKGNHCQEWSFHPEPLPLAAIYILGDYQDEKEDVILEPVNAVDGLIVMATNTYVDYMLDRPGRQRELELLSRIVTNIPIRLVRRPFGLEHLPAITQAIVDEIRSLTKNE